MGANSRRQLYYEADQEFDPFIKLDVNEYLIETWPQLSLKQRTSVWTLAQNDEEFDFSFIQDQIDEFVYQLAETDKTIELPPQEDDENEEFLESALEQNDDEEESDDDGLFYIDVFDYLETYWPQLTEEQLEAIYGTIMDDYDSDEFDYEPINAVFDGYVEQYATDVDTSIDLEYEDETEEPEEQSE